MKSSSVNNGEMEVGPASQPTNQPSINPSFYEKGGFDLRLSVMQSQLLTYSRSCESCPPVETLLQCRKWWLEPDLDDEHVSALCALDRAHGYGRRERILSSVGYDPTFISQCPINYVPLEEVMACGEFLYMLFKLRATPGQRRLLNYQFDRLSIETLGQIRRAQMEAKAQPRNSEKITLADIELIPWFWGFYFDDTAFDEKDCQIREARVLPCSEPTAPGFWDSGSEGWFDLYGDLSNSLDASSPVEPGRKFHPEEFTLIASARDTHEQYLFQCPVDDIKVSMKQVEDFLPLYLTSLAIMWSNGVRVPSYLLTRNSEPRFEHCSIPKGTPCIARSGEEYDSLFEARYAFPNLVQDPAFDPTHLLPRTIGWNLRLYYTNHSRSGTWGGFATLFTTEGWTEKPEAIIHDSLAVMIQMQLVLRLPADLGRGGLSQHYCDSVGIVKIPRPAERAKIVRDRIPGIT